MENIQHQIEQVKTYFLQVEEGLIKKYKLLRDSLQTAPEDKKKEIIEKMKSCSLQHSQLKAQAEAKIKMLRSRQAQQSQETSAQDKLRRARSFDNLEQQIEQRVKKRVNDAKNKLRKKQYASTGLELGQWTCDPECQEEFEDISKDEYLGNLDQEEYRKLTQDDELTGILLDNPEFFKDIVPLCIRRRKSALAMSNSKKALARKLLSEDTINLKKFDETPQRHGWLSKGYPNKSKQF